LKACFENILVTGAAGLSYSRRPPTCGGWQSLTATDMRDANVPDGAL